MNNFFQNLIIELLAEREKACSNLLWLLIFFQHFDLELRDLNTKSQNLKKTEKNQFQIKGVISYPEEASSQNRKQNLNAQGAEKISTTIANCQKVKCSFFLCKKLNYDDWKKLFIFGIGQ